MPKTSLSEGLPVVVTDHRAVRAWERLHPHQADPERVETLGLTHKTAVYRIHGAGLDGGTVIAKRCRTSTAAVERLIYEQLLPSAGVPALRYFGWLPEPGGSFCWLFLEDAGVEAYSPANEEHRALAGRWLAAWHRMTFSGELREVLPDRSPSHYLRIIRSSQGILQGCVEHPALAAHEVALLRGFVEQFDLMRARWGELQRFFESWPSHVAHGDFVVKNLRLRAGADGPELLVFDWEMAGWGVPAADLAQRLGKTASPDLGTYAAIRRGYDPRLRPDRLERLAAYGDLFRLVDKVAWEAQSLAGPTYEFLVGPITKLKGYEPQLTAALRALRWTAYA